MAITTLLNTLNLSITPTSYLTYLDLTLTNFLGEPKTYDDLEEVVVETLTYITTKYKSLHIISEETGEILYTINLNNPPQEIPNFGEKISITGGEEVGGPTPPPTPLTSYEAEEWNNAMEYEFNGFFYAKDGQTYMKNGVMQHKPPMNGLWATTMSAYCTAEFRKMNGEVTDRFYGNCNDFEDWFNAKASRDEKFKVYVKDDDKMQRVGLITTMIGKEKIAVTQSFDGEWKVQK